MNDFEQICRPVLFESVVPDFAYWGKGSSFLISNPNHFYWVTATHVLNNAGASADAIRIFPSDNSRTSLPFNEKYAIHPDSGVEGDYKDVTILRIDLPSFDRSGDAPLIAQDIERAVSGAENLIGSEELWIIGYPAEQNLIDYDSRTIKTTRSTIRAEYVGGSFSNFCHTLRIRSSVKLDNLDGLSGSPIFHMKQERLNGELVHFPILVGMLLSGTASSGIAHFVSSSVIARIVTLAESQS